MSFPALRMRRLRKTSLIRELVKEVRLDRSDLIQPIFVEDGLKRDVPIPSMPGQRRQAFSTVGREVTRLVENGVRSVILFGIPADKDETGSAAYDSNGIIQKTIYELKQQFGDELVVLTDVCLCQYTSHGHCGLVKDGRIDNDETLPKLAEVAVSHAHAGADMVAPSAMIDGQVKTIRDALDVSGEFSMIKAAAREGWIDEKSAILEVLTSIKRAGADMILTYHAVEAAEWLR